MLEPHIVLLTSDNVIRIYSLREPQTPTKVIVLSEAEEESLILNKGRAYTASLGPSLAASWETAPRPSGVSCAGGQRCTVLFPGGPRGL